MHCQPIAWTSLRRNSASPLVPCTFGGGRTVATAATRRRRNDSMLRMLLARYMAVDLNALLFGRETNGRPCLQLADAPDSNFSDTGGGTVLAFGSGGRVGIDNGCWVRTTPTARLAAGLRPMRPKRCLGWRRNSGDVRFFDCGRRKKLRYRAPEQHLRPLCCVAFRDRRSSITCGAVLSTGCGACAQWRVHRRSPIASHTAAVACLEVFVQPQDFRVVC